MNPDTDLVRTQRNTTGNKAVKKDNTQRAKSYSLDSYSGGIESVDTDERTTKHRSNMSEIGKQEEEEDSSQTTTSVELLDSDEYEINARRGEDDGEKDEEKTQASEDPPDEIDTKFRASNTKEEYENLLEPIKKRRRNRNREVIQSTTGGEQQKLQRTTLAKPLVHRPGITHPSSSTAPLLSSYHHNAANTSLTSGGGGSLLGTTLPTPANNHATGCSKKSDQSTGKSAESSLPLCAEGAHQPSDHFESHHDLVNGSKADDRQSLPLSSSLPRRKNDCQQNQNTNINQHSSSSSSEEDNSSSSSSSSSEEGEFVVPTDDFVVAIDSSFGYGSQFYLPAAIQEASSAPFLGAAAATRRAPGDIDRSFRWNPNARSMPNLNLAQGGGAPAPPRHLLVRSSTASPTVHSYPYNDNTSGGPGESQQGGEDTET